LKIAFLHYHLKTGGVTTVLKQQIEAVRNECEILVFCGSGPSADFPAKTVQIPALDYTRPDRKPYDPEAVAESISAALRKKFGGKCDVLHVHNPLLAKNKQFLKILRALQKRKIELFLQVHDFAEDGRPQAYFHEAYPADCHYGVINSRDYHILRKAGLKTKGLHLIANMVNPIPSKPEVSNLDNFVLYPIRVIRRKNIGEALLLSRFFRGDEKLVFTLPPNSPLDIESYRNWKSFVKERQLKVAFDAGLEKDFRTLVHSAKFLITTSITEGFGFSFLEPWVYDKLIWGRKLSPVCIDFERKGIRLGHLYDHLWVPLDWVDRNKLYAQWSSCIQTTGRFFNFPISNERIAKSFERVSQNGRIDFGLLHEGFQKQIISRLLSGQEPAERLRKMNPFLSFPGEVPRKAELIELNKKAVLNNYNRDSYRCRLLEIYDSVSRHRVRHRIDKTILLSEFLDLNEFSLLKWCNDLK
jgi:hypothetical protein